MRRDLGNRASPVNRAHMKRPLVSFSRNSHVLRHLLSIKFADEGTVVTNALACEQAVAWSRHATKERVQRGMTLQEAWQQCSFFLPTIILPPAL